MAAVTATGRGEVEMGVAGLAVELFISLVSFWSSSLHTRSSLPEGGLTIQEA